MTSTRKDFGLGIKCHLGSQREVESYNEVIYKKIKLRKNKRDLEGVVVFLYDIMRIDFV